MSQGLVGQYWHELSEEVVELSGRVGFGPRLLYAHIDSVQHELRGFAHYGGDLRDIVSQAQNKLRALYLIQQQSGESTARLLEAHIAIKKEFGKFNASSDFFDPSNTDFSEIIAACQFFLDHSRVVHEMSPLVEDFFSTTMQVNDRRRFGNLTSQDLAQEAGPDILILDRLFGS